VSHTRQGVRALAKRGGPALPGSPPSLSTACPALAALLFLVFAPGDAATRPRGSNAGAWGGCAAGEALEGCQRRLLASLLGNHARENTSAAHLGCSLGVAAAPVGGAGGVKSLSASARAVQAGVRPKHTRSRCRAAKLRRTVQQGVELCVIHEGVGAGRGLKSCHAGSLGPRLRPVAAGAGVAAHRLHRSAAMSPPPSGASLPLVPSFACSAVAACLAEASTLPLDTAKVRLQMQGGLLKPGEAPKYRCVLPRDAWHCSSRLVGPERYKGPLRLALALTLLSFLLPSGLFGTLGTVAREEGVSALWKGLEPGVSPGGGVPKEPSCGTSAPVERNAQL
jgi:hypothetical protein